MEDDVNATNYALGGGHSVTIATAPFGEFATLFRKDTVLWVGTLAALKEAVAKVSRKKMN